MIDVIVPTYRRPELLVRCLGALAAQTRPADRVIVVARLDDVASHDLVRAFDGPIRDLVLVTVDEPGVLAAMSAGLAASSAVVVAFTDDDAAPRPEWIERLLGHFEEPSVGAVGGRDVVPGQEAPLTDRVGVFEKWGRVVGKHHLGRGPAREVDILKGVNMAFRAEALALAAPGVLRGSGAQVDFELLTCAYARRAGWRVVYDPAMLVDHEGAPRQGADQRVRPAASAVFDAAFNSVVAACALEARGRVAAYGLAVGTHDRPGIVRALAGLARRETEVLRRVVPALLGRLAGVLWLARHRAPRVSVAVSGPELRSPAQSRPRVALVAHDIHDHGGMERACAELLRHRHGDFAFTVVSAELAPELRPLVDRWVRIRVPMRPFPLKFVAFFIQAGLVLRRLDVDLVHTVGAIGPQRADVISVFHCHAGQRDAVGGFTLSSLPPMRRLNTALSRWLALLAERTAFRPGKVGLLVCSTASLSAEVSDYYPSIETAVVPNGVATTEHMGEWSPVKRQQTRQELGATSRTVVVLFLGGDWHRKGLPLILEALALVDDPNDVALWVVGRGDRAEVERRASALGVAQRVTVVGPVVDVAPYYEAADMFVLASSYETFSIPCFEAAARGLPVVVTDVHGARDLVGNNEAGLLVERDASSIAVALARLAGDSLLRSKLGEEGRRRAAAFTWEASAASIGDIYRLLLAEARS